ncbi:MAG TPA: dynamin family protein [Frankiaceae bacterium]|nr:dynamin family protein [Frankiaceae bacterium]
MSVAPAMLDRLGELCATLAQGSPEHAPRLRQLAATLDEPLSIAIVGAVNAGKSTLVNALVNRKVAATDRGECTRLVTRYRFGEIELARAILDDGTALQLPYDPESLFPEKLGVPYERVKLIDVTLSIGALKRVTIVDTPGINSTDEAKVLQTLDFMQARQADGVLFVSPGVAMDRDREFLRQYRLASGGPAAAPTNAVGVLSCADRLAPRSGEDPWPAAQALAAANARELGSDIATVIPVIGQLAETANAGLFGQEDERSLHLLAALPAEVRRQMLSRGPAFLAADCDVALPVRTSLLRRLGLYGLSVLLEAAAEGAPATVMRQKLIECSGLDRLEEQIRRRFENRRAVLRAARSLTELRSLAVSLSASSRNLLLDELEALEDDPLMHGLEELRALGSLESQELILTADQRTAGLRLLTETEPLRRLRSPNADPETLVRLAGEAADYWTSVSSGCTHQQRTYRTTRALARSAQLLSERLTAHDTGCESLRGVTK